MELIEQGIYRAHRRACRRYTKAGREQGARCSCAATSYQAEAYDPGARRKIKRTHPTLAAARAWRQDTQRGVRLRQVSAGQAPTLREAADQLLDEMAAGTYRSRNKRPYGASTIETYTQALNTHVVPGLGADTRLDAVDQWDCQDWLDELCTRVSGRTARNALMPLQVIFKHQARRHRRRLLNPTLGLDLPEAASAERPFIEAGQFTARLAALPTLADRSAWGLMLLAGLRLGEVQALAWEDVHMEAPGRITIRYSWCKRSRVRKAPKSGRARTVTMPQELRRILAEHHLATGGTGLVITEAGAPVMNRDKLVRRAARAWQAAGMPGQLGPHGARHSFVSAAIAGNVPLFKAQGAAGHSAISTTANIYGHAYHGDADDVAAAIDSIMGRTP